MTVVVIDDKTTRTGGEIIDAYLKAVVWNPAGLQ
jgi:hypothetical protein